MLIRDNKGEMIGEINTSFTNTGEKYYYEYPLSSRQSRHPEY